MKKDLTRTEMEKAIVLHRLFASDPNIKLSISTGSGLKTFTRAQLIDEVQNMSDFGLKYIEDQLEYTRSLASGKVYSLLEEIENL